MRFLVEGMRRRKNYLKLEILYIEFKLLEISHCCCYEHVSRVMHVLRHLEMVGTEVTFIMSYSGYCQTVDRQLKNGSQINLQELVV